MVKSTTAVQVLLLLACVASAASVGDDDRDKDKRLETVVADESGRTVVKTTTAAATTTTGTPGTTPPAAEPKDVSIIKQINKVNDDGSYTFGYEASDGSFKVETRDVVGNVKGMFGFVDESGRLKRVSYSANNSSGFQAAGGASPPPPQDSLAALSSVQTIPPRKKTKDDEGNGPATGDGDGKSTGGVKKVLVSKRPVTVVQPDPQDETERRRDGNDLRRQLPRNDDGDAPDVYGGVHGRSSMQSGPVSPVVSALMSELDPIRVYRPQQLQPTTLPASYDRARATLAAGSYDGSSMQPPTTVPAEQPFVRQDTISRQAQDDDESPPTPQYRPIPVQRQQQQQLYRGGKPYHLPAAYPVLAPYQQQQQQPAVVYGPNLASLRDELMELILSFVQARISQLMPYAPAPSPYPMPYQQPNYYVPSYYQGPRVQGVPRLSSAAGIAVLQQQLVQQQQQQQDDYVTADSAQQQSSPRVTQTLKDGLIRMLLSTSPRYDPERFVEERSTPRLTYRRTTQSTPVRNVQIIGEERTSSTRPVTTETPD